MLSRQSTIPRYVSLVCAKPTRSCVSDHVDLENSSNFVNRTGVVSSIMASKGDDDNEVESPPFSAMRLMGHILTKGVQAGSVVGGALLLPALYCYNSHVETKKLTKLVTYTLAGGVALSGVSQTDTLSSS